MRYSVSSVVVLTSLSTLSVYQHNYIVLIPIHATLHYVRKYSTIGKSKFNQLGKSFSNDLLHAFKAVKWYCIDGILAILSPRGRDATRVY